MCISWLTEALKAVLGRFSPNPGGNSDTRDTAPKGQPVPVSAGDDRWDTLIRKYAGQSGVPWFIVKAVIWQESRFNPAAKSHCGAMGLMQLMPSVYKPAGIDPLNPEQNIRVGCTHLKGMWDIFKAESGLERWKFALGSYNAGPGYVIEAQELAKQYGAKTYKWYHVAIFLDRAQVGNYKCEWKQVTEYVDLVIGKMYDYILMHRINETAEQAVKNI